MRNTYQITLLSRAGELQRITFNSCEQVASKAFYALVSALSFSDYSRAHFTLVTPSGVQSIARCELPWRG